MQEPVFFPLGPKSAEPQSSVCIVVCVPGDKAIPVWGNDWDSTLEEARELSGRDDWVTEAWLADLAPAAAGRGRRIRAAEVVPLARVLGQHSDPGGFGPQLLDEMGFATMQSMALFAAAKIIIPDGTVQPFYLDVFEGTTGQRFPGVYERSGPILSIYLMAKEEHCRALIDSKFTALGHPKVPYLMARALPANDRVGAAVEGLFGTAFRPMIRSVLQGGREDACNDAVAKFLSLAMTRAPQIAAGADHATGLVTFQTFVQDAEMRRVAL